MGKERGLVARVRTRTQSTLRVTAGQKMYLNYYYYGKLGGAERRVTELVHMVPCPESERCFLHEMLYFFFWETVKMY